MLIVVIRPKHEKDKTSKILNYIRLSFVLL